MSTYTDLLALRVTRNFLDRPVAGDDLDAVLEAGRWTGSSKNRQAWAFHVVATREALDELATAGDFTEPIRNAPAAIALIRTDGGNDFDIGRAAQTMMLAAATRGLGSCPVTLHHEDRARRILALPDGQECRWVIALGHPDQVAEAAARAERRARGVGGRKARDEVVRG